MDTHRAENFPAPPDSRRSFRQYAERFLRDLVILPPSHKWILTAAALIAAIGWSHWAAAPAAYQSATTAPSSVTAPHTTLADVARHLGTSVLTGYVIGWLFRVFKKTVGTITFVLVVLLFVLSWTHFMNIDFTPVRHEVKTASAWLIEQAVHLKNLVMNHLGSPVGGAVGLFVGARKRKVT